MANREKRNGSFESNRSKFREFSDENGRKLNKTRRQPNNHKRKWLETDEKPHKRD